MINNLIFNTNLILIFVLQDGILVENMHDIPYVQAKHLQPETTAMMSKICSEIRKIIPRRISCGVQV